MPKVFPNIPKSEELDAEHQHIAGKIVGWQFWCPGCKLIHSYNVEPSHGPTWNFDGSSDKPSFTPSLLVTWPPTPKRCHLFVREGFIEYCADCTHSLKNSRVEMTEFPDQASLFEKWSAEEECPP